MNPIRFGMATPATMPTAPAAFTPAPTPQASTPAPVLFSGSYAAKWPGGARYADIKEARIAMDGEQPETVLSRTEFFDRLLPFTEEELQTALDGRDKKRRDSKAIEDFLAAPIKTITIGKKWGGLKNNNFTITGATFMQAAAAQFWATTDHFRGSISIMPGLPGSLLGPLYGDQLDKIVKGPDQILLKEALPLDELGLSREEIRSAVLKAIQLNFIIVPSYIINNMTDLRARVVYGLKDAIHRHRLD